MKLNIAGCRTFIERKGIGNYRELSQELGIGVTALLLLEQGNEIGYDAVRDLYNSLGEQIVSEIIDFGEETLDGFKSKYVQVGNTLY
mgnify:FL=1